MPIEYVDSDGRVPRGMADIDNASMLRHLILLTLTLDHGGTLEIAGFGDADHLAALARDYELKVSGVGAGVIRLEAIAKTP